MRADLLDAKAAVDWAIAQLPVLQKRIIRWRQDRHYSISIDIDTEPGQKLYRLSNIKPIDPITSAEAGAIIHSIRSSLDVLACALAARNGHPDSRTTYFPIWKTRADFDDPRSRVLEKIKRLSDVERGIIKSLKPYPGGHDLLCTLHDLDLTRKHRRLLGLSMFPRGVFLSGIINQTVTLYEWDGADEKAVILSTPASTPDGEITVNFQIALNEADVTSSVDCTHPIREFASAAAEIIDLFDGP
jgi:hypothetical protein